METIDINFLRKEMTGGVKSKVPIFFIAVFGAIIVMMLAGSVNSPHDVKIATWGMSVGLGLVCVVICGILPLLSHKKNSDEPSTRRTSGSKTCCGRKVHLKR